MGPFFALFGLFFPFFLVFALFFLYLCSMKNGNQVGVHTDLSDASATSDA